MDSKIKAVIFDLGGVVIEIDFCRVFAEWQDKSGKIPPLNALSLAALEIYQRHERDEVDFETFYHEVNRHFDLGLSRQDFEYGWNQIFIGPMPGVENILQALATQFPVYAFSNTNPTHERVWRQRYPELIRHFAQVFTSTALAERKPEPRAYRSVLTAISCLPQETLFLDDHTDNVLAARQAGMHSREVRSAADITETLIHYGLQIP